MDKVIITEEMIPTCLKDTRLKLGLTQKLLCEKLNLYCKISAPTLSLLENSKLKPKAFEKFKKPILQWLDENCFVLQTNKVSKKKVKNYEIDPYEFSQLFKTVRKNQSVSQSAVCDMVHNLTKFKIKLNQGTISAFERNKFSRNKMLEIKSNLLQVYLNLERRNKKLTIEDKNTNQGYQSPPYPEDAFDEYNNFPVTPYRPDEFVCADYSD